MLLPGGEKEGSTPQVWPGKAGACGLLVPVTDVCSWWALSVRRCGQWLPWVQKGCSCILTGMVEGAPWDSILTPPPPCPDPLEGRDLAREPGSPVAVLFARVGLRLHSFSIWLPWPLGNSRTKGSSPHLPEPLALGCWVEPWPFYTGGVRGGARPGVSFLPLASFPIPGCGVGDRLGLGRGRGGGT